MIRTILATSVYTGIVLAFLVAVCTAPASAFQATTYARVVAQAEQIAYLAAQKSAMASTVAAAAVQATPPSTLVRVVAGASWIGLAITAGTLLFSLYYSAADLQTLKTNAAPPSGYSGTNPTHSYLYGCVLANGSGTCTYNGSTQTITGVPGYDQLAVYGTGTGCFTGWANTASWVQWGTTGAGTSVVCWVAHVTGQPGGLSVTQGAPATQSQIQTYVQTLPDSDPNSLVSHTAPGGSNHATPAPADNTVTQAVETGGPIGTTVKPKPVPAQDAIVADNVPPPQGTQTTTSPQTQAATTASVTNPDGSKTDTTTATVSCTASDHEPRTMASVLQAHQATWTTTGLIGAVNLLKNLTWPTTLPVISLPSQLFGTQTVNFNDWAWAFTALRSLVIATATLAAYRLIFVGGR